MTARVTTCTDEDDQEGHEQADGEADMPKDLTNASVGARFLSRDAGDVLDKVGDRQL